MYKENNLEKNVENNLKNFFLYKVIENLALDLWYFVGIVNDKFLLMLCIIF